MDYDKDLLGNHRVFTGELRISDDQILRFWIEGHGASARLVMQEIDASETEVRKWGTIDAKHLSLLKTIAGFSLALNRDRAVYHG